MLLLGMLHNIAKTLGDPDFDLDEQIPDEDEGLTDNNNDDINLREKGQAIRNNLSMLMQHIN